MALDILRLDARQLLRDRLAWAVLALGLLCSLAAAAIGSAWIDRLEQESAAFLASAEENADAFREAMVKTAEDPEAAAALPARLTRPIAFPTPRLADFSIGRSDIEPTTATLRMGARTDTLFSRYQMEHAERLARGRLDLSFVAIVLAPLLLIALGYGVYASDREQGTARLILAQAGAPLRLIAARSFTRLALVAAPLLIAGAVLLLTGPQIEGRLAAGLLWLAAALLGLLFWWAVILLVNSLRITAESAAFTLVGLWALLVFVAPAAINAAAQAAYPPPSRLAQIAAGRAAGVAANAAYENDHPEMGVTAPEKVRESLARSYRIGLTVERQMLPGILAFERQLAGQQAVVGGAQLVSPPMSLAGALSSIAGVDAGAYDRFRVGARESLAGFKALLAGPVEQGRPLDAALERSFAAFLPTRSPTGFPLELLWTAFLTAAIGGLAVTRLRRAGPLLD
jgi:hypothetical protein